MTEEYDPITGERITVQEEEPEKPKAPKEEKNIDPLTGAELAVVEEPGKPAVKEEPGQPAVREEAGKPVNKEEPGSPANVEPAEPPAEIDPVTGSLVAPDKPRVEKGGPFSALKGMISFFTIIRLPIGMKEMDAMERHFWMAPVVGFIIGFLAFFITLFMAAAFDANMLTQAVMALALSYLFSKFIHFDGLVDFGDGMICSSGKREDHVRALKDTLVGAGGVGVAIITILLAVLFCAEAGNVISFRFNIEVVVSVCFVVFGGEILVKNAQVAAAAFGKPGNGMAARQVSRTTRTSLILSTILTAVLLLVVIGIYAAMWDYSEFVGKLAWGRAIAGYIVAIIGSILTGAVMANTANKTFGFVNGDILGATNEISRVVVYLLLFVVAAI